MHGAAPPCPGPMPRVFAVTHALLLTGCRAACPVTGCDALDQALGREVHNPRLTQLPTKRNQDWVQCNVPRLGHAAPAVSVECHVKCPCSYAVVVAMPFGATYGTRTSRDGPGFLQSAKAITKHSAMHHHVGELRVTCLLCVSMRMHVHTRTRAHARARTNIHSWPSTAHQRPKGC